MAANNNPGSFASLASIADTLTTGAGVNTAPTALSAFAPASMGGNTALQTTLDIQEQQVLGSLHTVPQNIRDQLMATRHMNEMYLSAVTQIRSTMPPMGIKPTAATLAVLDTAMDSLALAAGGPDTNMQVSNLIQEVTEYTDLADDPAPAESVPEEPPPPQDSAPDNDSGGSSLMAGLSMLAGAIGMVASKAPKVSLTKGGYPGLKSASPKFAPKAGIKFAKTPPKKGPGGPTSA